MADKEWRVQMYGPLGIMETLIKLIAIGAAIASLSIYQNDSSQVFLITTRVMVIVCICILTLFYLAICVQRFLEKELLAILFSILQFLGALIFLIIAFKAVNPADFAFVFSFLYMLGTGVKLLSLFMEKDDYEDMVMFPRIAILVSEVGHLVILTVMTIAALLLITLEY